MKKVLVLVLVLGLATVSNASLQLLINGGTSNVSVPDNAAVTVAINMTDTAPQGTFLDYINGADIGSKYSLTGVTLLTTAGDLGSIDAGAMFGNAFEYGITIAKSTGFATPPGVVMTSTVTGLGPVSDNYVVTLQLWDSAGENVVDTKTITFVPEPITMALLGLGGLFIRRRTA